jgi:RNA polymerase sigma-70 factor (family 1)
MPGCQTLLDSELITLLREGDHSAYTQIYERYYYLMFVFAYKKLRNEDLAKDFVQELFTKLWIKKDTIVSDGNLSQYLYISLRSRMFDYFGHQKVEGRYLDFLKNYAQENKSEHTDHLIREKQLTAYIEKQIQSLPYKMRKIFELSRKEHLSHKDIANKLGTSEHNVSKQITNALKILRTKLGIIYFFISL